MATDPVIIDDGGSTRIIRLVPHGPGSINGLLDVAGNPPSASATLAGPFDSITGVSINSDGTTAAVVASVLVPGDNFTVSSDNAQRVDGVIEMNGDLTLTISGPAANPPVPEAKQFHGKRRYEITNAGAIQRIQGMANGAPFNFQPARTAVYTNVIVS